MFQNMIRVPKEFEDLLRQCAEEEKMAESRLQHDSGELRAVADLIDSLNGFGSEFNNLFIDGLLKVFWEEIPMGTVKQEDGTWVYYPEAKPKDG